MEGSTSIENENRQVLFPAGNRFCPTDEELIVSYLLRKLNDPGFSCKIIKEVDLYKFHPEELIGKYGTEGEKCNYFFTPTQRKYPNGCRPKRSATGGFWKATSAEEKIEDSNSNQIGLKKSLCFHNGFPKAGQFEKTTWLMQEFRASERRKAEPDENEPMKLDNWVLCKIYEARTKKVVNVREVPEVKKGQEGEGEAKEVEREVGTSMEGQEGEGDAKEVQGKDSTDIEDICKCMDADCIEDVLPYLQNLEYDLGWHVLYEGSDKEEAMRLFLDAGI